MKIVSERANIALLSAQNINLNLGSGDADYKDWLNVDIKKYRSTDILADLNNELDLIPENSVSRIFSRHTFEHISNLDYLLSEIYRICSYVKQVQGGTGIGPCEGGRQTN